MQAQRYSTPSWSDLLTPERCEVCERALMPEGMDWGRFGVNMPDNPWLENWNRAWGNMYDTWVQAVNTSWAPFFPQQQKQSRHMHRCQDCEQNDCDCRCCVGEADLLVHARVGESRVVPLVIENDSHRERKIELELSDWESRSSQQELKISARLVSPSVFSLEPCSEEKVILVVQIAQIRDSEKEAVNDVKGCQVYYADLRVKGCDIRPVRIALAVLARDCAPLEIECRCGCC